MQRLPLDSRSACRSVRNAKRAGMPPVGTIVLPLASLLLLLACADRSAAGEQVVATECYALRVDEPGALHMLDPATLSDTLILSDVELSDDPGDRARFRAFFGTDEWRAADSPEPSSWYWTPVGTDSIRIAFVLPLWGIVWEAKRTADGLAGTARYRSDDVDEPPTSTTFTAERVPCPSR